jgi:hypothetical protein
MIEQTYDALFALTMARMKTEILADIRMELVPYYVSKFSELHDHVDANEYGGFCEDLYGDVLMSLFGPRDEHEGMPEAYVDFMNHCQCEIDFWLRSGRKA